MSKEKLTPEQIQERVRNQEIGINTFYIESVYRDDLSLDQIAIFEYFVMIARYSRTGTFRIFHRTLEKKFRIGRRSSEAIVKWLVELGILIPKPVKRGAALMFYFCFEHLMTNPKLIFAEVIPDNSRYVFLKNVYDQRYLKRKLNQKSNVHTGWGMEPDEEEL